MLCLPACLQKYQASRYRTHSLGNSKFLCSAKKVWIRERFGEVQNKHTLDTNSYCYTTKKKSCSNNPAACVRREGTVTRSYGTDTIRVCYQKRFPPSSRAAGQAVARVRSLHAQGERQLSFRNSTHRCQNALPLSGRRGRNKQQE